MAYSPKNPNGQATMANSEPVVIASNQSAIPVTHDDTLTTGSIAASGEVVTATALEGMAGWTMAYYGTYATGASLTMEVSFDDGTTFATCRMLAGTTSTLGYVLTIAAVSNSMAYFTADIPTGATHLRVRCSAWAAPTGAINVIIGQTVERFATPPGAITLTSGTLTTLTNWGNILDNAAFTDGTTRLSPNGFIFDEVAGTALTENDAAAARIDAKRAQIGVIEDATTRGQRAAVSAAGRLSVDASGVAVPVTDNGGSLTVDGTVTANAGTNLNTSALLTTTDFTTVLGTTSLINTTQANGKSTAQDGLFASAFMYSYNGTTLDMVRNDGVVGGVSIGGTTAHDAVDAGNPVKVGGQARTTNPTAVADADRVSFIADKLGKQVVVGSIRDLKAHQVTTISNTSETTVLTAVAATFLDVYGVILTNTSTTDTEVAFKDATGGTTRFTIAVPAGDTRGFMLPESAAHNQATVNNNWTATAGDAVSSLVITMFAVKNT